MLNDHRSGHAPQPPSAGAAALLAEVRIVAQSPLYIVIDKPSGLLSVPGLGLGNQHSAASWCQTTFPAATGPLTVHRLDMHTSGLLLLALDPESHRHLSRQFEARTISKSYLAIVDGQIPTAAGTIDLLLRPDLDDRPRQIIDSVHGRPALTHYQVLSTGPLRTRSRSRRPSASTRDTPQRRATRSMTARRSSDDRTNPESTAIRPSKLTSTSAAPCRALLSTSDRR